MFIFRLYDVVRAAKKKSTLRCSTGQLSVLRLRWARCQGTTCGSGWAVLGG